MSESVPWLLFGAQLELDALARMFLPATALVWLAAGVSIRTRRLQVFSALAALGNLGLCVAGDLASVYTCFALTSVAGYGMLADRRAGRVYMSLTILGELALFTGLVLAASLAPGDLGLAAVTAAIAASDLAGPITALLFVGFGVKLGVLFVHMWMPLGYTAAPSPAAAALAGAMINAGLIGWLRVAPLGLVSLPGLGSLIVGFGVSAAWFGVLAGLPQRDAKTILAYSSVSQMGLVTAVIGVALAAPSLAAAAIPTAALFGIHHGLSKGALFLGLGAARRGSIGTVALTLVALSIAGLPGTSGAIAKHELAAIVHGAPDRWHGLLAPLLSLSSTATLILMLWFLARARARDERDETSPMAALILAAAALVGLWVIPERASAALEPGALWSSTWPALLGIVIYPLLRRVWPPASLVPPGDIVVAAERGLAALGEATRRLATPLPRPPFEALSRASAKLARRVIALERHAGWPAMAIALTALLAALALLLRC